VDEKSFEIGELTLYIHSFYGDLLLSVRVLFDRHIFQNRNYVKRYEFNMGNRAIQLPQDYKPNFEFPNIMVMLNDDMPTFGQKPTVTQNLASFNIDQTPVLYNTTTGEVLCVQEEMVNLPITCTINCESQFQAKEISAIIRKWLPINKFIQFLEFTSYLEVSPMYLNNNHFNPATQQIGNLYTKLNKRTGEIDYCFSLSYRPFIRLDSISTAIPDSVQRSFQVVIDITYMVQRPISIFNEMQPGTIERIDMLINPSTSFEPINDYPSSISINYLSDDVASLQNGFVRRTYLLTDNNATESVQLLDQVTLNTNEISKKSVGGEQIEVTRGANDYLYITLGTNTTTQYKVNIDSLPVPNWQPTDEEPYPPPSSNVTISVDENRHLVVSRDLAGNITTALNKNIHGLTIKFDPNDFLMSPDYSYNLVKERTIYKDYTDYVLDIPHNSITFNFNNQQFSGLAPSLTSPLLVQFYLKNAKFPKQIGGVQPHIGLVRVTNITTNSAIITWVSDVKTTTQIEYSEETTNYDQLSELNPNYTYDHRVILTGLHSGLCYHFRINTETEDKKVYISEDYKFETLFET